MRTPIMKFHSRARHGVRATVVLAASVLVQAAWHSAAAAQVERPTAAPAPVIRCCVDPPVGMTFWLPFNGSYTDAVASLPGTPSGTVAWVAPPTGHPGNALGLAANGRVDYPASPATSVGDGHFSVDAWIRLPQTAGVNTLLDNRLGTQGNNLRGFGLFTQNGRIGFQLADGINWDNYISTTNVSDNRWHFVVVTVTRNAPLGGTIWVDGSPAYTFNPTGRQGSLGTNNHLAIGHDLNNGSQGAAFEIDDVEIFRRVLTQPEIVALYRYPKCLKQS
jgi:hypothetical protein